MKIDVQGPSKTVKEVLDSLREKYDLEVGAIEIVGIKNPIYDELNKQHKERLGKTIEFLYDEHHKTKLHPGKKYIAMMISATTTDGTDAVSPLVRYILN